MDLTYIGENLKTLRLQFGLTQRDVAKKIGINTSHYSHIERGERGISILKLIKVCEIFNTTFEYLLTNPIINYDQLPYITDKERINQLTYYQLKNLTEENCRIIYELAIILSNKQFKGINYIQ